MRYNGFKTIATSLLVFQLACLPLSSAPLQLKSGEFQTLSIYNAKGVKTDVQTASLENGSIIQTKDEQVTFSSTFGEFTVENDSMLVLTDTNEKLPTLYLLTGGLSLKLNGSARLTLYTPSESYRLLKGDFHLLYTENETFFQNKGASDVTIQDAIRGENFTLKNSHAVNMFSQEITNLIVGEKVSHMEDEIFGRQMIKDISLGYAIDHGKVVLRYEDDFDTATLTDFFTYLSDSEKDVEGVRYEIRPNTTLFYYPENVTNEEAYTLLVKGFGHLHNYIGKFTIPAVPLFKGTYVDNICYQGEKQFNGITIGYDVNDKGIQLTVPESILPDAITFVSSLNDEGYILSARENTIQLLSKNKSAVDNLRYLETFLSQIPTYYLALNAQVHYGHKQASGFSFNYAAKNHVVLLSYPSNITDDEAETFLFFVAQRHPELTKEITYTKDQKPGRIELYMTKSVSDKDLERLADLLASELSLYFGQFRIPSAPRMTSVTQNFSKMPAKPALQVTSSPSAFGGTLKN